MEFEKKSCIHLKFLKIRISYFLFEESLFSSVPFVNNACSFEI